MRLFDLAGKVAVVTGGAGHLGKSMVRTLLNNRAKVIVADQSPELFYKAFSKEECLNLTFKVIDITKSESINIFFKEVFNEFKKVDIMINNAHTVRGNPREVLTDDDWNYTFEGISGSVYKTIKVVAPSMMQQRSGKIINISSMYGIVSPNLNDLYEGDGCEEFTNPPHYGAAKAAVNQITRYFAALLGSYNIQVNAIAPGPFPNTDIQVKNPAFINRLKKKNPLNRIGRPEDLDGVIALLSSSASDFITGQTIQVDGGWTIW